MRRYHICRTSRCRPSELLELLQLDWWITRRTARHELRVHRDRTILECFDNASQLDVNRRSCYRIHIRESDIKRMLWTFIFLHVLGVSMSALEAFAVEISHSLVGVWNGSPRVSAYVTQGVFKGSDFLYIPDYSGRKYDGTPFSWIWRRCVSDTLR